MPHPTMFDPDDPLLARVRTICLALPRAQHKVSHGRPAFFTTKVFAYYGGSTKVDGHYVQHPESLLFLPDHEDEHALAQDARVYRPAYLGPHGWLGLDLGPTPDWDEVAELVECSFRRTVSSKTIANLEAIRKETARSGEDRE